MRKLVGLILLYFVNFTLWFRYRVTIKGVENLDQATLKKPGGVLFLPNHPTIFVDPTLITTAVFKKFPIRPMVVEYMYYTPIIHSIMKFLHALPIPNFINASNSIKKKKADRVIQTVIGGLKTGENFLIYPAGKVKHTAKEVIGGSSAVHRIIQSTPEANVVLVRITGLWGSSFSQALTGKNPGMFATIFRGMKMAFKNLIFFMPRRPVTIEFIPAPADFPYEASRLEMNHYLENWYNRPDGLSQTDEKDPGETLSLVSYSLWKEELPEVKAIEDKDRIVNVDDVPEQIQTDVKEKLSEMSEMPVEKIKPDMSLSSNLGLDSLDTAELLAFLDDNYDVSGVPVNELTTVSKVIGLAGKKVSFTEETDEEQTDLSKWTQSLAEIKKERISVPEGVTIPEVFLNNCARLKDAIACGDATAGTLTFSQAKLRVLLLAEYIRKLPGDYIGILLPSSVAAYLTVLACQLAGKVPLLINWTVGARHLESVVEASKVQTILSSWAFLDRLENANLDPIEDLIVTLEDARRTFSLTDKLKAFYRSKRSTKHLLSLFKIQDRSEESTAVLLFTSGTENMPKGVPLSHKNILSNQRGAVKGIEIFTNDVLIGILPPFHAFGFTVSGLLPFLTNVRVAYYPDPTNGKGLAKAVQRWKGTFICGAPTFLKAMFKSAKEGQLKTLRLCVSGAEKAPSELFKMVQAVGAKLVEGYGITECSPILTINDSGDSTKGVGRILYHTDIRIIDLETHKTLPSGQQGLIVVRGPGIFSAYINKGTASPFIELEGEPWYSTGDLGHLDSENNLVISGRLKRFVKIGAEMVSLSAIESTLQHKFSDEHHSSEGPLVAICAREEAGERSKIFLFTRLDTSVEDVNRTLKEAGFSNLVKVSKVQKMPEIPIMGTGKINYRALETQLSES